VQLERLNAEQAARTKRERRRANEVKTKTIQRMQLQMTAPMDIGMEQHDASLGFGQDDVFDLTGAEKGMRKKGGAANLVDGGYEMPESDESGVEDGIEDEDEEMLDSDEEREWKIAGLEAELDGMYDIYQERMKERDAKFKVKEARKKSGQLEEWNGIKEKDTDDEDSDSEEGGWEQMEAAKEKAGADSSSDESDEEDIVEAPGLGQKRRRNEPPALSSKRVKLLTKLEKPQTAAQTSRAAQVWFSQDVFAGIDELRDVEDDADEDVPMDGQADNEEDGWQDEVSSHIFSACQSCPNRKQGLC
jgi:AdoMet-dependent rRNA methyltransferase SPB1